MNEQSTINESLRKKRRRTYSNYWMIKRFALVLSENFSPITPTTVNADKNSFFFLQRWASPNSDSLENQQKKTVQNQNGKNERIREQTNMKNISQSLRGRYQNKVLNRITKYNLIMLNALLYTFAENLLLTTYFTHTHMWIFLSGLYTFFSLRLLFVGCAFFRSLHI